jgi:uroporphyrin-III C-methyltransferase/precorrin-2 dehydrogenase/sirohydrochlorin ferrochelatase
MQQADVVVYDHLVSPAIVDLVRRDAEKIGVDVMTDAQQDDTQQELISLLLRLTRKGRRVLCLTACESHLFNRVAKTLLELADETIDLTMAAGITTA